MVKKDEKEAQALYNNIAEEYHTYRTKTHPRGWFFNEMLEMPSTLALLGNVRGKKVLDFGCGSGIYAKILRKNGARVKGFDISEKMLAVARRNNPQLDLRLGSGYNIPFQEQFDIIIAPLVMDYLEDWNKVFRQVKKVLKKRGVFIFSVGNPVSECVRKKIIVKGKKIRTWDDAQGYFTNHLIYVIWSLPDGKSVKVPGHHKSYETIMSTFLKNGFEIIGYKDCFPEKRAKKLFPEEYARFSKQPYFCVWKVRKK